MDGALKTSYLYNGHGKRVIKVKHTIKGASMFVFRYDPDCQLITETRYNLAG